MLLLTECMHVHVSYVHGSRVSKHVGCLNLFAYLLLIMTTKLIKLNPLPVFLVVDFQNWADFTAYSTMITKIREDLGLFEARTLRILILQCI